MHRPPADSDVLVNLMDVLAEPSHPNLDQIHPMVHRIDMNLVPSQGVLEDMSTFQSLVLLSHLVVVVGVVVAIE